MEEDGGTRNEAGAAINGFGPAPGAALIGAGFIGNFGNPFPRGGALVVAAAFAAADSC